MNYVPTTSQRKEKRVNEGCQLHSVNPEGVTDDTWQNLVGKNIFFWSWTIDKIKITETARTRFFIFHTTADLGFYKVHRKLSKAYPTWYIDRWTPFKYTKNIAFPVPYLISHAIEVKTPEPLTWLDVMEKITRCIEPELRASK
jgi:hypothetical protein